MENMENYRRFEEMCRAYIDAGTEQKKAALALLNEQERRALLQGVAIYQLMTEPDRYEAVKNALGEEVYRELTAEEAAASDVCRTCGHWKNEDCELMYEGVLDYDPITETIVACEDYEAEA